MRPITQHLAREWARAVDVAEAFRPSCGFRRPVAFAIHLGIIAAAYALAFALRFDFDLPPKMVPVVWATLPLLVGCRMAALAVMGVHRGSWRHVGLSDLVALAVATTASTLLFAAALYALGRLVTVPRSVLLLDWILFIFLAGGIRFATRFAREAHVPLRGLPRRRTLVIGAGDASEQFLRQSLHGGGTRMQFVGLLDDNPDTHGLSLHGIPVLGPVERLAEFAERQRAALLVIAISSATGEQMRRIVGLCTETGLEFKIIPPLDELLNGRAKVSEVREVRIEDLLGRDPIRLDLEPVERDLAHTTALVTGAAGSIGSELARQIAGFRPARLILYERAESPLYFVNLELRRLYPDVEIVPVIGDVTDVARLDAVFAAHRPDYVFHAAAYKHVPMMECHVGEAVRNNVIGTLRVAECAARHGVGKFVLISTDKAVNPTSVMGTTKRLAELIVLGRRSLLDSATDFRAVRFGNVLGSDGSVIPLFKRQLACGGPLTVTHPDVQRYFMSIPEAVQLVLQAAATPEARRRIVMLEMGEPVRIVDLAEQLIRLSGLTPYRDVQIVYTGLRPGEKLNEELMSLLEASVPTAIEKVRIVETGSLEPWALDAGLERLTASMRAGDEEALVDELRALVPEYVPEYVRRVADREVSIARGAETGDGATSTRGIRAPAATPFDVGALVQAQGSSTLRQASAGGAGD